MSYFVLIFDPKGRKLEKLTRHGTREDALRARFSAERHRPDAEIVVLAAQSETALRRTHGRYFNSASELLRQADLAAAE